MSAGTTSPDSLKDVLVFECFFTWPDGRAEKKFMHKIDFEEAKRADPKSWSLELPAPPAPVSKPPKAAAPAKSLPPKPAEKSDPTGPKIVIGDR